MGGGQVKPGLYIFINEGLDMSAGKIAAQAGHAAVEAVLISHPELGSQQSSDLAADLWDEWRKGLHYVKYVMAARDSEHLFTIEHYLNDRGFRTRMIIDEGHTEIDPIQPTALGVALVDKDDPHTAASFEAFKLLRAPRPSQVVRRTRPFAKTNNWLKKAHIPVRVSKEGPYLVSRP